MSASRVQLTDVNIHAAVVAPVVSPDYLISSLKGMQSEEYTHKVTTRRIP